MNLFAPLLLIGAIAAFGATLYLLSVSLAEARPFFPPQFQQDETSRGGFHTLIWQASIPASTRRKYFLSLVSASAAVGCIALLMVFHGSWLSAILFGVVFVFMAVVTLTRWTKYRASL